MASETPDFAPVVGNDGAGSSFDGNEQQQLRSELSNKLLIGEASKGKSSTRMASSSYANNKIVLTSSDGVSFEVSETVAREFQIVAHMLEDDDCDIKSIPLSNVTGDILSKVIQYCEKHVEEESGCGGGDDLMEDEEEEEEAKKKLQIWDKEFMKPHEEDMDYVFQMIMAANYLSVEGLLDLTCTTAANYIKDKKPEEVRQIFNIENDLTPEEEAEILKENKWAFDN